MRNESAIVICCKMLKVIFDVLRSLQIRPFPSWPARFLADLVLSELFYDACLMFTEMALHGASSILSLSLFWSSFSGILCTRSPSSFSSSFRSSCWPTCTSTWGWSSGHPPGIQVKIMWMGSIRVVDEIQLSSGWDLVKWLERLAVYDKVGTVPGSIPGTSDTVESEGRQMKQCWITYNRTFMKKKNLK